MSININVYVCFLWTPKTADVIFEKCSGNFQNSPADNSVKFCSDSLNAVETASTAWDV